MFLLNFCDCVFAKASGVHSMFLMSLLVCWHLFFIFVFYLVRGVLFDIFKDVRLRPGEAVASSIAKGFRSLCIVISPPLQWRWTTSVRVLSSMIISYVSLYDKLVKRWCESSLFSLRWALREHIVTESR